MRYSVPLLVILLIVFTVPGILGAGRTFSGKVIRIIDGDSLIIDSDDQKVEIRLYGIDCPEYNQPYGRKAKTMMRRRYKGLRVEVLPVYYDAYDRLVAVVAFGNQTLNSDLVDEGLAWVSPKYCRKKICRDWKRLAASAKKARRGLWNSSNPIPPWRWKKR